MDREDLSVDRNLRRPLPFCLELDVTRHSHAAKQNLLHSPLCTSGVSALPAGEAKFHTGPKADKVAIRADRNSERRARMRKR